MVVRAFSSAVSGLQGNDLWLDVIGNNIANTNSVGYKSSRALFADRLSQKLSLASSSGDNLGGVNGKRVGLGSRLSSIQTLFHQGQFQTTGQALDLAIEGDGFLMVERGGERYLTRAGNLSFDGDGYLVDARGGLVQGTMASYQMNEKAICTNSSVAGEMLNVRQSDYVIGSQLSAIRIPQDMTLPPKATTKVDFKGNLDAGLKATAPGGILDLGTGAAPILPIALNLDWFGPVWATDSTRLTYTTLASGGYAFRQVSNMSSTVAYPITNGMISIMNARGSAGNYAWEHVPPLPPASTLTATVYDSTGAPREVSVLFYQVNDLGDGGVNPPDGPNQAVFAWYAFETTGGIGIKTENLIGGTGIIEGENNPWWVGQWYYDRGIAGDLYAGDFVWFNTDGSLASTGGSGGPVPTPPGQPNFMTIPRIYLPAQNINPPISPFPTHGAEILCVDLDFGTGGILGDGRRDGLYSAAAGSYEVVNGVSTYMAQNTAYASHQDGYPDGSLQTLSWDSDGVLTGGFSNGQYLGLARLGLARVQNPEGLSNQGGTTFVETANSGAVFVGAPGAGGLGVIRGGTLETSNVDLPTELNYMIIAQRSFEANARTATVANEMLQTAVNLGR